MQQWQPQRSWAGSRGAAGSRRLRAAAAPRRILGYTFTLLPLALLVLDASEEVEEARVGNSARCRRWKGFQPGGCEGVPPAYRCGK